MAPRRGGGAPRLTLRARDEQAIQPAGQSLPALCCEIASGERFLLDHASQDRTGTDHGQGPLPHPAAVVLITLGQEERRRIRAKHRESSEIRTHLGVLKDQIHAQSTALFATPFDPAAAHAACHMLSIMLDQVSEYAQQVGRFAVHLDFASRAHVSGLLTTCGGCTAALAAVMEEADAPAGNPDWDAARRSAVNVQNAIELAKL